MTVVQFKQQPKEAFDDFWDVYPRHVSKAMARRAFANACKVASPSEIILGAIRFAEYLKREGTEMKYIPHPSTWLNGERWEDELPEDQSQWGDFNDF